MNVNITDKIPNQRNGDKKTLCRKIKISAALFMVKPISALF